jgi:type II secretory pathway component PulF
MDKDLAVIYYNLSIMLDAGMSILKSLNSAAAGSKGGLGKTLSVVARDLSKGSSLAEEMAKYPRVFASLDVITVETAETSGDLPRAFKLLSQWYEFRIRLKRIVISGLMLPLVILHVAAFVIPLRVLMGRLTLQDYLTTVVKTLAILYVPVVIVVATYYLIRRSGRGRRLWDAFVLRIPILGQAVRQLALSRYCRAFNMLLRAGVPITACAQKAADASGSAVMAELLREGAESARAGNMVCEGFGRKLPADFVELWRTGEEVGELDNTVARLAENTSETGERLAMEFCKWVPRIIYFIVVILMALFIITSYMALVSL